MSDLSEDPQGARTPGAPAPAPALDAAPQRATRDAWLTGPGDLETTEIDVPGLGDVTVRSLSAGQLARMQDACLTMKGETMKLDTGRLSTMKFAVGVVDPDTDTPMFTESEANVLAHQYGCAFSLVVQAIDDISKATDEDVQKARRRFRPRR